MQSSYKIQYSGNVQDGGSGGENVFFQITYFNVAWTQNDRHKEV